jgi:hypothetical protein
MVDLDVKEVLEANGGGVVLHDVVGKAAQDQPPRLAGLFDDLSYAWERPHGLSISFEHIDLQTL